MRTGTPYRVEQTRDTSLQGDGNEQFEWRYLYGLSAESFQKQQSGQDYLTFDTYGDAFMFAVCDGVGQSFFGDLAARLLGDWLLDWLRDQQPGTNVEMQRLRTSLSGFLTDKTGEASAHVASQTVPADVSGMVREILADKREIGSESTFVCARIDLPSAAQPHGRLLAAWMGDSRLRAWGAGDELADDFARDTFRTAERWSSKYGPIDGEPHVVVLPLVAPDGHPNVTRLMAYSDGLSSLDSYTTSPSDTELEEVVARSRSGPTSDDTSFIELRLPTLTPVEAPALAPVAPVRQPGVQPSPPRRRRAHWASLVLNGVAVALLVPLAVVVATSLSPSLGQQVQSWLPAGALSTAAVQAPSFARTSGWQTPSTAQAEEIRDAYVRYWTVLAQAFRDQDAAALEDVATGDELEYSRQFVRDQRRQLDLSIAHRISGIALRGDEALVTETGSVTSTGGSVEFPNRVAFLLLFQDGKWRVAYAQ